MLLSANCLKAQSLTKTEQAGISLQCIIRIGSKIMSTLLEPVAGSVKVIFAPASLLVSLVAPQHRCTPLRSPLCRFVQKDSSRQNAFEWDRQTLHAYLSFEEAETQNRVERNLNILEGAG
jgi:hypothetical protein